LARVVRWARRHDVPVALYRSHNKLDSFGVEYGRLGSIVLTWRRAAARSMRDVVRETRDAIRLLGVAPIPAHLPPFADDDAYVRASAQRTAALIRNARRLHERLQRSPLAPASCCYRALACTSPSRDPRTLRVQDVQARRRRALCAALTRRACPRATRIVRLRLHRQSSGFADCATGEDRVAHRTLATGPCR
jgi:hypothetical protein